MILAAQIRAARGILGWSQTALAKKAGLSLPTIKRMEGEIGPDRSTVENVDAVVAALEGAGVEFTNGGSPGVRLAVKDVYANPNSKGVRGVVVRWRVGDPVQWMTPAKAREVADKAERLGEPRLPGMFRKAADRAELDSGAPLRKGKR